MITRVIFSFVLVLIVNSKIYSQGNWKLLMPTPTSNQMTGLYFYDDSVGWSVGEYGTILKTTDGGETWSIKEISWLYDLTDVHFPSALTGYAIGTDGFIIKSTDGGESWEQQDNTYSNNLSRILFKDELTGWAIGEKSMILHTVDGGDHWLLQTSNSLENLRGIDFIGTDSLCVVGENKTILLADVTDNSWSAVELSTDCSLEDVFFADSTHGWACGYDNNNGIIFKSVDRGHQWQKVQYAVVISDPIQQIFFYENLATGFVLTEDNELFKTTSSGSEWAGYARGYGEFPSDGRFCALNNSKLICTGYGGDFRYSNDQGTSWYLRGEQYLWWNYSIIVGNDGHILAHKWDISSDSIFNSIGLGLRSSDYGTTWTEFQPQYLDTIGQPIVFPDRLESRFRGFGSFINNRDTLWLVRPVRLPVNADDFTINSSFISTDFGLTYKEIRREIHGYLSTFLTPDTIIGYYGGSYPTSPSTYEYGILFSYSFDCGLTVNTFTSLDLWNVITIAPYIEAHYFFNGRQGFLVGSDGNIVKTYNCGQSWENIYSGVVEDLHDITFIDKQTGFVVGDFGRILKTIDGGAIWYKTDSGTQQDIFSISFINEHDGWVGTENGLRYTTDAGETWQGVPLRYSHGSLTEVVFDDAGKGYAYNKYPDEQSPTSYVHLVRMLNNDTEIQDRSPISQIPNTMKLSQNFPNPFNSTTRIEYFLPGPGFVSLKIFNIQGQLVSMLVNQTQKSGKHSTVWDGLSDSGVTVSSGVYFYELRYADQVKTHKLLLLK
ncbi:MAG: T9SS type A sorting domain-containing protein [Calditrichaceae bacterium]|nr:T9SS type A sorting domain-containing protein [Calditrichaceae bacterium]